MSSVDAIEQKRLSEENHPERGKPLHLNAKTDATVLPAKKNRDALQRSRDVPDKHPQAPKSTDNQGGKAGKA